MSRLKNLFEIREAQSGVMRLLSALCISSLFLSAYSVVLGGGGFTDLKGYAAIGLIPVVFTVAAAFLLLTVFVRLRAKKHEKCDERALFYLFSAFSVVTVLSAKDYYYTFGICAAFAVLLYYFDYKEINLFGEFTKKKMRVLIIGSAAAFTVIFAAFLLLRYFNLQAPNYDFGIFCQAFRNLRSHFQPLTTVERDGLLSHFSVHMSLIYYLVLPFYAVFPSPVTLQLFQVFALASAVVPVYLLCRRYEINDLKTALLCVGTVFHPALFGGGSYDFHENCFLVPLLLWAFYFFEKEKYPLSGLFCLLTCLVKEDAPVYVVFFALWAFISRKKYKFAVIAGIGAAVYFVGVLMIMSKYGDGIMSGRYGNFLCDNSDSLFVAVKNVLADPGYVFTQLLADKEGSYAAKLLFIIQMMLPFAFMPFAVKKISDLILLFPMLLVNLMSLYVYQYDIAFQYVFGPLAFIIYLAVINTAPADGKKSGLALKIGAVSSALLLMTFWVPRTASYISYAVTNAENNAIIREYLATVPEDASVCSSTMFIPHLADREVLYEDFYHEPAEGEKLDYIIIDGRYSNKQQFVEKYEELGYKITETVKNSDGDVLITVLR